MPNKKTVTITKEIAAKKAPATAKKTVKHVSKPATKKLVVASAKSAVKETSKTQKIKVVRDNFSMPQDEYEEIAKIKASLRKNGIPVKKSEVLRAALKALGNLNMMQKKRLLAGMQKIKTTRSNKR
jgi:LAS superfamily LD-carboxypeptidase LdcB